MESIINDFVNTDFKELLLKFDYSNLNNNLFYKGSYYNLDSNLGSNLSSPDKIKSPGSEASLNKESKDISNISNSISNVSLVSLVSQVSHISQDSSDIPRCYPENNEIFRCFNYFNQSDLKYIILGQDPYHNGQANGLAFSINEGEKQPASLRTINKEYNRSMNTDTLLSDLSFLAEKGTLLLNTALTVEKSKPGSHAKLWEPFTQFIIEELDKEDITFFLWGNHAKKYKKFIKKAIVMESGHPSPLNRKNDFIGNDHFLKIK